jgi:hypothetical protein
MTYFITFVLPVLAVLLPIWVTFLKDERGEERAKKQVNALTCLALVGLLIVLVVKATDR